MPDIAKLSDFTFINPATDTSGTAAEAPVSFIPMAAVAECGGWRSTENRPLSDGRRGYTLFQRGDVIVAKITPCFENGKVALLSGLETDFGLGSTEFHVLRAKPGHDPRFIYHWTRHPAFLRAGEASMTGSAGQRRVPASFFERFEIAKIEGPLQGLIAEILDAIDDAVLETDSVISKLLLIHQGLIHDLTTFGLNENGEIRRAERETEFSETELGLLPRMWGVESIGRMANDLALGTAARGTTDGKQQLRLLKMGNLGWDTLDSSTCELIDVERVVRWRGAILLEGDLLFNTRNTPELVGKTAAYDQDDHRTVCDNNILRIRFPAEKMDGHFAAAYMGNGLGKSRILALATGTTSVAAIYWRDLRNFKLPTPPREEREEIVRRLHVSRGRIHREREYRAKLSDLRDGLRDDLLTGRKPVMIIREAAE
ncbi:hypothetical protein GOC76_21870 [Sinorhizobium medicae]|nr:hypothetical protein [Sinorhizobium medicae]